MIKYFGTDGIRGRAHEFLTPELAKSRSRFELLHARGRTPGLPVVFGSNTEGGRGCFLRGRGDPQLPSIKRKQTFGVISGSHNPYHDNGIKFMEETQDEENTWNSLTKSLNP